MKLIHFDTFFDYIDQSACRSARQLSSRFGVWLDEWRKTGVQDVLAVDRDYVNRDQLAVAQENFMAADLTAPVFTDRRFDLAQSLEVGEHLPTSASETLVDSLTRASDRVLFSAAVTGQGGEFHVNEQPLSFWQDLFKARGYTAYDCIRPHLSKNRAVEPWYRNNAILYVNEAGLEGLPDSVTRHAVPDGVKVHEGGDAIWRLRRAVVSKLPRGTVTRIAQVRAKIIAMNAQGKTGGRAHGKTGAA